MTIALHGDQEVIRLQPLAITTVALAVGTTNLLRNAAIPERAWEAFDKGVTLLKLKSDSRGATVQFERAKMVFPGYFEAYAQMGVGYDSLGDAALAEKSFRKSIEVSSGKYTDPLFSLAEMFNDSGRFADAEQAARQGITSESGSSRGHFELARALVGLNQDAEAEPFAIQARDL